MSLRELATIDPLYGHVPVDEFLRFIQLGKLVRPSIEIALDTDNRYPPPKLPGHIQGFLAAVLQKPPDEVSKYWHVFKDVVWSNTTVAATEEDIRAFWEHGLGQGLGAFTTPRVFNLLNLICPHQRSEIYIPQLACA